jgi:D-beta-D-heptose 7-phosphate kinase/D-beta-D-heptose 1-phosphate adenosyltransferase
MKKPNILVIGDLMIDHYLWGDTSRISPEAPVQVIDIANETSTLGGAGNVVNNLVALGSDVTVMSVLGNDDEAIELQNMLEKLDIQHYLILDENRKTTKKSRIIASNQQVVRYDKETKLDINQECEREITMKLLEIINNFDIVLISDYGKGVITNNLMSKIIFVASGSDLKVIVDPKGNDYTKYRGAYTLTPNKSEAELACEMSISNNDDLEEALKRLRFQASLELSLITLSEDGIVCLDDSNNIIKKPTLAKEVYDVTGAGDTVLASMGYCLSQKMSIQDTLEFSNLAAGVVIGKLGSATASLEEIEAYKTKINKNTIQSHIKSDNEIQKIVQSLKANNSKIVFTNGCFDILHKGHASYLDKAKSFGDVLIVGLNTDSSVRQLKGKNRPINTQEDRAYMLSALKSVDYVVTFNQDTPYELIKLIQPDTLVKGADYTNKEVVGSDIAKELKLVKFVDGKSTTQTIEKITNLKGKK